MKCFISNQVQHVKSIFTDLDVQSHIDTLIDDYYTKAMKSLNSVDADVSELERFASLLKKREN